MKSLARSAAYKALDLITGGRGVPRVIGGETFRMPARWSRYYDAGYEPGTFAFLRRRCRPGDTVMDIGAHIGLFTVFMARLVGPSGRVLSFEPTPYTCGVLREMVRINGCGSTVEVNQKAVSARAGHAASSTRATSSRTPTASSGPAGAGGPSPSRPWASTRSSRPGRGSGS